MDDRLMNGQPPSSMWTCPTSYFLCHCPGSLKPFHFCCCCFFMLTKNCSEATEIRSGWVHCKIVKLYCTAYIECCPKFVLRNYQFRGWCSSSQNYNQCFFFRKTLLSHQNKANKWEKKQPDVRKKMTVPFSTVWLLLFFLLLMLILIHWNFANEPKFSIK